MRNLNSAEIEAKNSQNKHTFDIVFVLENTQYAKNVASLFRTAEAAGVGEIYLVGHTTTPPFGKELANASRGMEKKVKWRHFKTIEEAITNLKKLDYYILGLELTDKSVDIRTFQFTKKKIAVVVGNEVGGLSKYALGLLDSSVFIPMFGKGNSLNVATSLSILVYNMILNNT